MPEALQVVVLAALPISELRGAIPLALWRYDFHPLTAYGLAVLGNLLPLPFLLPGWRLVFGLLDRVPGGHTLRGMLERRAWEKSEGVRRWGPVGLFLFVAVPLPVTGLYTGSLVAHVLGIPFRPALFALSLGVLTAGVVVLLVSLAGWPVALAFFTVLAAASILSGRRVYARGG